MEERARDPFPETNNATRIEEATMKEICGVTNRERSE